MRKHWSKEDDPDFIKKYNVRVFPTVLFFNSNGEEIDRICGWDGDKEVYFQQIIDYVNGKNTIGDILEKIHKDSNNITLNYQLAMKYVARHEGEQSKPYFDKILNLDPSDEQGYGEEARGYLAIYEILYNHEPAPLLSFLKETKNEKLLEMGYNTLIRYYNREKNQTKLLDSYEALVSIFPENANYLNQYAWYIYENKVSERYDRGIKLARKAVKIRSESAAIWDTLSWLLFETGKVDEAIECMEKAVDIDPDQEYYRENLKKMREGDG